MSRVLVVAGLDDDESICLRLATLLADLVTEAGSEAAVVGPRDAQQPGWAERVSGAEAYLWVVPETRPGMTDGPAALYGDASIHGRRVGLCTVTGGATAAITTLGVVAGAARLLGLSVAGHISCTPAEVDHGLDTGALEQAKVVVGAVLGR